jgi:hypothetical protein
MADEARAQAIGEHAAIRYLLADIVHRVCRQQSDPAGYAKDWSRSSLKGWDRAVDRAPGNEVVSHAALHELETFWANLLEAFPEHGATQPRRDG